MNKRNITMFKNMLRASLISNKKPALEDVKEEAKYLAETTFKNWNLDAGYVDDLSRDYWLDNVVNEDID